MLYFYFVVNAVQPTRAWSYPSGVVLKNTTVYGTDHRAMKNLVVNYSNIVKLLIIYTFTYISSPQSIYHSNLGNGGSATTTSIPATGNFFSLTIIKVYK